MLKKSFKAAKCKTALKLASARIKLLKNKRDAQLKQMKRDIAQLLQTGQEQTARIRVEHVIREENTMAAYDIIELYCELIVARLPIIESQKHCPIDLREAITSVVFASPRCADIPELQDVSKLFTAKYGKEFVNSALELRPDCGVSRTVVEKLSARTPNGETKIKILTAIAQEHNVEWDPAAAEEQILKPPEDLLNGPSKFTSATRLPMETPDVQLPSPPTHKPNEAIKSTDNNVKGESPSSNTFSSGSMSTGSKPNTSSFSERRRTSESRTERGEFKDSWYKDDGPSLNRQNWNMEFKDATSAAQAAAESAERASLAARAAAELSSRDRFSRQQSTEPQPPETSYASSYKEHEKSSSPVTNKPVSEDSMKVDEFSRRSSNMKKQNSSSEATESRDAVHENVEIRSNRSGSSLSSIDSVDDETLLVSSKKVDGFSRKSPSGVQGVNQDQKSSKTEKENHVQGSVKKQPSQLVSPGPSVSVFDDDIADRIFKKYAGDVDEHASINTDGNVERTDRPSSSHYFIPAFDDYNDSVSENKWEMESENMHSAFEYDSYFPEGRLSSTQLSSNSINSQNPRERTVHSLGNIGLNALQDRSKYSLYPAEMAERNSKSTILSHSNDFSPANYDDSDGLDSEREEEILEQNIRTEVSNLPSDSNYSQYPSKSVEMIPKPSAQSQSNDFLPGNFDDSDGMNSESEEEILKQSIETEGIYLPRDQKISSDSLAPVRTKSSHGSESSLLGKMETEELGTNLQLCSSSDDSESSVTVSEKKQPDLVGESWKKHTGRGSLRNQKSIESIKSPRKSDIKEDEFDVPLSPASSKDSGFSTYSSFESGQELSFGRLKGGLKNKGFARPPYIRSPLGDDSPTVERKPSISSLDNTSANSIEDSIIDKKPASSSLDKSLNSSGAGDQKPFIHKTPHVEAHKGSSLRTHRSYFDSDSDEAGEKETRQTPSRRVYRGGKLSYRSRYSEDSSPRSDTGNTPKLSGGQTESPAATDHGASSKPTRKSFPGGQPSMPVSRIVTNESIRSSQRNPVIEKPSKTQLRDEMLDSDEDSSDSDQDSRRSRNSSVVDRPPKPLPKTETLAVKENLRSPQLSSTDGHASRPLRKTTVSGNDKNLKPSNSSLGSASGEKSIGASSHVHPKLPDYDTLAAHFASLKSNQPPLEVPDYDIFAADYASLKRNRPSLTKAMLKSGMVPLKHQVNL